MLSFIVILLTQHTLIQIFLFWIVSLIHQRYLLVYTPYESKKLNFIEIFNEIIFFTAINLMILFSDYLRDPYLKYNLGWGFISLIVLQIAVNFILIIVDIALNVIRKLKVLINKSKGKKKLKTEQFE